MLLAALSRNQILYIAGGVLVLQWLLAVIALYFLFKDKGLKKGIIAWNIFIMFGIIIGPLSYLISRKSASKR